MKTVDDFISELQSLKPSLRKLQILIEAPNGLTFDPKVKVLLQGKDSIIDKPKQVVITYE